VVAHTPERFPMYSKEFCRTVADARTRTDPEAARVIHWLLDALDETEVAALELKTQLELTVAKGDGRTWTLAEERAARRAMLPHSDQLCKGPNCNAVRGGVHSPECIESNNPAKK